VRLASAKGQLNIINRSSSVRRVPLTPHFKTFVKHIIRDDNKAVWMGSVNAAPLLGSCEARRFRMMRNPLGTPIGALSGRGGQPAVLFLGIPLTVAFTGARAPAAAGSSPKSAKPRWMAPGVSATSCENNLPFNGSDTICWLCTTSPSPDLALSTRGGAEETLTTFETSPTWS